MSRYREILQAVGDASDYLRAGGETPDLITNDADLHTSLRELPDDEIIPNYASQIDEGEYNLTQISAVIARSEK